MLPLKTRNKKGLIRLNVASECSSTILKEFIQHHAFYKLVLDNYSHVLQAASLLCILYNRGGKYVNVQVDWSKSRDDICHPFVVTNKDNEIVRVSVDPKDDMIIDLMQDLVNQLPVLPNFDNRPEWVTDRQHLNLAFARATHKTEDKLHEMESYTGLKFATLKFDTRVDYAKEANSGDEVQGYPGLQFLPQLDLLINLSLIHI